MCIPQWLTSIPRQITQGELPTHSKTPRAPLKGLSKQIFFFLTKNVTLAAEVLKYR